MKKNVINKSNLSKDDLIKELNSSRKELLTLRLKNSIQKKVIKNDLLLVKKRIAQIMTLYNKK